MTSDELKRLFGMRVQALRRRRGLTQEELAEAIGKSVDTISNIERGFSSTRIETAQAIAQTVGVTLAELFEFEEHPGNGDRERRKAVEQIIDMLSNQESDAIQAAAKIFRIILDVDWKKE
ncbi:transcriptional regulator with XRE-family HTH domain [Azospirillum fermentarium]|uniref:helix-turn-helix domain-containing protein n=1 Tax=Azospirillum fermentarium TaxID=1233114 RepID=UPI0022275B1B|nr:helix-turn-helix transcriptional regulator [Azospirillum fermentarium]MCW2244979.1 transcriptional regulator with XRE-family HTH domain [Azospirillum fermentarium]